MVLRLEANNADKGLAILAVGDVDFSAIVMAEQPADEPEIIAETDEMVEEENSFPALSPFETTLAGFNFRSGPDSGLLLWSLAEEAVASLTVNGAVVALVGTAFAQAQPGEAMVIEVAGGTVMANAADTAVAATGGNKIVMPLTTQGTVAEPPITSVLNGESVVPAETDTETDLDALFVPLVPPGTEPISEEDVIRPLQEMLARSYLQRFNAAAHRCTNGGSARHVYNVLYWYRVAVLLDPDITAVLGPARIAEMDAKAAQCLTFELDFDSTVTSIAAPLTRSSQVHASGLYLQFNGDGTLKSSIGQPMQYVSFGPQIEIAECPLTQTLSGGTMEIPQARLRIVGNTLRITVGFRFPEEPAETLTYNCPSPAPPLVQQPMHWKITFYHMHEDLFDLGSFVFTANAWQRTGNEHFAEAIYADRTENAGSFSFKSTTYLILLHTPER